MADKDTHLTVDADQTDLAELLRAVREGNRPIRILSHGEPVADLSPVLLKRFGPLDPALRAKILVEGHELTTEADWPDEAR